MRLDRFLSNLKYGTRKEIQVAIRKSKVKVDGTIINDTSFKIEPNTSSVEFDGESVYYNDNILLMLNKPAGYLSTREKGSTMTVYDLIGEPFSRFDLNIAGRLDKDTEGLLLLTNNGALLHSIISPNKKVYKKYYVKVDIPFDYKKLEQTIEIKDGRDNLYIPMNPIIELISDNEFYLSIHEGKYHQVKRMVSYFGSTVEYLKRVSVGNIVLDESLNKGKYKIIDKYDI